MCVYLVSLFMFPVFRCRNQKAHVFLVQSSRCHHRAYFAESFKTTVPSSRTDVWEPSYGRLCAHLKCSAFFVQINTHAWARKPMPVWRLLTISPVTSSLHVQIVIHAFLHARPHMYVWKHACKHVCAHARTRMRRTHTHTHTHICTQAFTHRCKRVCNVSNAWNVCDTCNVCVIYGLLVMSVVWLMYVMKECSCMHAMSVMYALDIHMLCKYACTHMHTYTHTCTYIYIYIYIYTWYWNSTGSANL